MTRLFAGGEPWRNGFAWKVRWCAGRSNGVRVSGSFSRCARGSIEDGAGDETRTRDINLGKGGVQTCRVANSGSRRPTTSGQPSDPTAATSGSKFINPHRLFHGVWLPQWLEERPEVSEKAKKLYAYLTYFAGGKGYAWPSFNHLAGKLHISRRYVIKLVQELSASPSHCGRPTSASQRKATARITTDFCGIRGCRPSRTAISGWWFAKNKPPFRAAESHRSIAPPSEQQITSPSELEDTSPGEPQITPLVIPSSPKENNKKRTNNKGKVPVTFSKTVTSQTASNDGFAAPQGFVGHDENRLGTPHCRAAKGNRCGCQEGTPRQGQCSSTGTRRASDQAWFHTGRSATRYAASC